MFVARWRKAICRCACGFTTAFGRVVAHSCGSFRRASSPVRPMLVCVAPSALGLGGLVEFGVSNSVRGRPLMRQVRAHEWGTRPSA